MRRVFPILASAALVAVLAATPGPVSAQEQAPKLAPAFRVRAVDGAALDSKALLERGPVLLDFWATWCKPCIAALPEIQKLHERWAERGLTVVGVSEDGPRNFSKVRPFARRLGLEYPIALDEDGSIQERFQVRALPTTVLIGRDGRVVLLHQGYRPGFGAELEAAIAGLLGEAPADSGAAGTGAR
jgi:peroxiredoxin